jgi:hypothetical protein
MGADRGYLASTLPGHVIKFFIENDYMVDNFLAIQDQHILLIAPFGKSVDIISLVGQRNPEHEPEPVCYLPTAGRVAFDLPF